MENRELLFELGNGGRLKVTEQILQIIAPYVQQLPEQLEAGGVLLGRFFKGSKDIIIDLGTSPLAGDKQTRYSFKRLSPLHQQIIDQQWKISKGTCNYLGEWHTHPEGDPNPSGIDRRDWKRKLRQDTFSSRFLYFIIVGTQRVRIWEGDRRTLIISQLNQITNNGHNI